MAKVGTCTWSSHAVCHRMSWECQHFCPVNPYFRWQSWEFRGHASLLSPHTVLALARPETQRSSCPSGELLLTSQCSSNTSVRRPKPISLASVYFPSAPMLLSPDHLVLLGWNIWPLHLGPSCSGHRTECPACSNLAHPWRPNANATSPMPPSSKTFRVILPALWQASAWTLTISYASSLSLSQPQLTWGWGVPHLCAPLILIKSHARKWRYKCLFDEVINEKDH